MTRYSTTIQPSIRMRPLVSLLLRRDGHQPPNSPPLKSQIALPSCFNGFASFPRFR
ncbi:hypothetical protein BGW80DRAFT_1357018, partial [Lactifluus volemus]